MMTHQNINPEQLTAAYDHEVAMLTFEVLEELGLLATMDDEQIERYGDRIYIFLSLHGVPELYRDNSSIFDEQIFTMVCDFIEQMHK